MQHVQLTSSMISSAGWEDGKLEITFAKGNKTYTYYNVPEQEFKSLVGSESPGKYFTAFIKGKYGQHITDTDPYRVNDIWDEL